MRIRPAIHHVLTAASSCADAILRLFGGEGAKSLPDHLVRALVLRVALRVVGERRDMLNLLQVRKVLNRGVDELLTIICE